MFAGVLLRRKLRWALEHVMSEVVAADVCRRFAEAKTSLGT